MIIDTKTMSSPKEPTTFFNLLTQTTLIKNLTENLGFTKPTPIQEAVIPVILTGKDVYAGAKTGSGKTMAFLLPVAQMIFDKKIKKALVLSPTRELALQTDEEAMKVLDGQKEVVSIPLYGGVPLDQQLRALKAHKPSLYIATPGRMIDFMSEEVLDLNEIELVVLDEADRMCDMGFSPQIIQILSALPQRKQNLMFSATLPKDANEIMNLFLRDAVRVQVDNPETSSSTIEHRVVYVSRRDKTRKIAKILSEPDQVTVIFCRTRKGADRLYKDLSHEFDGVAVLHAGFEMNEREKTIRAFRDRKISTLIATDVASRGLDVEQVTKVIQYELPETVEDYIHRSGRAGRAGRSGISILLVDRESLNERRALEQIAKKVKFATDTASEENEYSGQREHSERPRRDQGRSGGRSRQHRDRDQRVHKPNPPRSQQASKHTGGKSGVKSGAKKTGLIQKTKKLIGKIFGRKPKANPKKA